MKRLTKLFLLTAVALLPLASCGGDDNPTPNPNPTPDPTPETPVELTFDVPDKDGMTIKGVVYCGDKPLENVVVSDGDEVTVTDKNGHYYLKSTKKNMNVFVSIPSGYSMKEGGMWPKFYQALSNDQAVEQHNFELIENTNKNYVVIGLADIHIANVRECVSQYSDKYLPDLNKTINDYKIGGKEVYVMCLGDQSHDLYWYDKGGIDLEGSKPYLSKINANYMFTTMGNHDNDPYIQDDFLATARYRVTYGPTHFSYNVNGTHYIMLDDIVYKNVGATGSGMGDRSYDDEITQDQIDWLRKDLAYVKKNTPIVIGMHAPLWKKPSLSGSAQTYTPKYSITNGAALVSVLNGYNVTVLSGHAHMNASSKVGTVEEYNVGSGAGRLWYSGQKIYGNSQHLCGDGSPAGFLVMEVNGTSKRVFYKGTDCDPTYQFRTYDMNKCHITAAKYCPASTDALINTLGDCMNDYKNLSSDNRVRINVFGYKETWKIRVTEGGKELPITRLYNYDPLWIVSVPCRQLQIREGSLQTPTKNAHIFECKASSATSTLQIEVTDDFGNIYRETMTRPKDLTVDMR